MPYCTNCGNQVGATEKFCGKCGLKQGVPGAVPPSAGNRYGQQREFLSGLNARTASMLCYIPVLGWIPSVAVLAAPRFQHDKAVRFHAFQGLYLFVVWLIVDWVVDPFLSLPGPGFHEMRIIKSLLKAAVFVAWIFMLIKTSQEELFHLPIVGELADRSVSEQR